MVRHTARVLIFEILGGVLFLAVIAAAILAWRLSQGPMELDIYRDDIARALTEARGGREVEIERVQLQWSPEERRVDVLAQGITFYSSDGEVGGFAGVADIELDVSALLFGRVDLLEIELRDARLEIRQETPDIWSIASEPLPPIPAADFPETPEEWLGSFNRVLGALLIAGERSFNSSKLSRISFQGLDLDVILLSGERAARIADASGAFNETDGDISLTLSGIGEGEGLPEKIALGMDSFGGFSTLDVSVQVEGWTLSELASRMAIREERVTGLPANLTIGFQANQQDGLSTVTARATTGAGAITLAGRSIPVTSIDGEANYDTGSDTLDFAFTQLDAGVVRGAVNGSLGRAVFGSGDRPFSLRAPAIGVDARPYFSRPWSLQGVEIDAQITPDLHTLILDRARARTNGIALAAAGRFSRNLDLDPGELPFSLNLVAEVTGETGAQTVLDFWPETLADGARRFVERNVEAGVLTGARASISLSPDSFAAGHIRDEDLSIDFSVRDADVRFLPDIAPIRRAAGTGRLTGNSFSVALSRGNWMSWTLDTGSVAIPFLFPIGGDMIIDATGRGPVQEALAAVFRSELNLEEETGFNPDRASGEGEMAFNMVRPALDRVPLDDATFSVTGQIRGGGVEQIAAGFDLTNSTARVDLTQERILISGFGSLGPATVNYEWREEFDSDAGPGRIAARSVVTPDVLNRFGLLGRPYITGEIPVELAASVSGETIVAADVDLDFSSARLDFVELGWLKPPGDSASAKIVYSEVDGERFADAWLDSETAKLAGRVRLGGSGRLIEADLDRAFLAGRVDVSGQVSRGADDGLALSVSGPLLDISGFIPDASGMSGGGGLGGAITLDAEVDRLVIGDALVLRSAQLAAIAEETGVESFTASGQLGEGNMLEARYRLMEDGNASVSLKSDDAGALLETFFDTDLLVGGVLDLEGVLRSEGETTDLNIRVEDTRLRNAPFLTQILSLASLRGLADTLGGDGVLFSRIDLPLRTRSGRYVIDGGRASGPAMGLTVNGWVEPESGGIAIDGVLVPSYGVNSALGGIPIIGDLFVGREGEGVFSLTYSVRGELERAQVAVNPLSAITPGVLRRIFENPSQTDLPLPDEVPAGE
ncbi:MAG: AsmA-like C-terminal region-containing protein [Pseudomonadota bacterium]